MKRNGMAHVNKNIDQNQRRSFASSSSSQWFAEQNKNITARRIGRKKEREKESRMMANIDRNVAEVELNK